MKNSLYALIGVCGAGIITACSGSSDATGPKHAPAISSDAEAKAAFASLKSEAEAIDRQLQTNFRAPVMVSGMVGSASVAGSKSSTSSSSSSSVYSSRISDLNVDFASFQSRASGASLSGHIRWTDYYDSRTACSSTTCASSSHHSQSLDATSIDIVFSFGGKSYHDRISVDAGSSGSSWSVVLVNGAGQRFTFTAS